MMASEVIRYLQHFIADNGDKPMACLLNHDGKQVVFEVVQTGRLTLPERDSVLAAFICGRQFEALVIPASMQHPTTGKG